MGDPLICHTRGVQEFGPAEFAGGAYLAGHLAESKEPGDFWGKGWLKLEFDRTSLHDTTPLVPGKIVAVRGHCVDRQGKIIGHGHPRRDAIEWMITPLWPEDRVTPARGPRPTLKGETEITLRLMDDAEMPLATKASRPAAGQPAALRAAPWRPPMEWGTRKDVGCRPVIRYARPAISAMDRDISNATLATSPTVAEPVLTTQRPPAQLTLFVLKGDSIYGAIDYWIERKRLLYVVRSGAQGALDLDYPVSTQSLEMSPWRGAASCH